MLSKNRIQEVILENIFQKTTADAANKIALQLGLPPGSVILGDKAISITEGTLTRHVLIAQDGRSVVFVDPKVL